VTDHRGFPAKSRNDGISILGSDREV